MLIVADAYYPGWRAMIDGTPTNIYVADYALRAIELPQGDHHVEMVFDPLSYKIGLSISSAAWLALIAVVVWRWRIRRDAKPLSCALIGRLIPSLRALICRAWSHSL
jgi:uncharacterized membrane protein YfhO